MSRVPLHASLPLHDGLVNLDRTGFLPVPSPFADLAEEPSPLDHRQFTTNMSVLLGQSLGLCGCAVGAMGNPECAISDILQTIVVLNGHLESMNWLWQRWQAPQEQADQPIERPAVPVVDVSPQA